MDEISLKVEIEQKFKNYLMPKLPEVIYGGLIHKKELLIKILKTQFNIDSFIYYLTLNYTKDVIDLNVFIINQLLYYLGYGEHKND